MSPERERLLIALDVQHEGLSDDELFAYAADHIQVIAAHNSREPVLPAHSPDRVEGRALKRFERRDIQAALEYAAEGGQALHVWDPGPRAAETYPKAPKVFLQHRPWAHLFDYDTRRLRATARRLGIGRVFIDRRGGRRQHVDLCGVPLERAIAECGGDQVDLGL